MMSLLTTKLGVPRIRADAVLRPRLIERMQRGLDCSLTLISAPAGFGKTTLLAQSVVVCGRPVAWLSLDRRDNDVARFWSYVVAALQRACPGVGQNVLEALQSPHRPALELLLTELINGIAAEGTPVVLVLDDLHVISSAVVHEGIIFLLEHLPEQMHLAVSTRADPPWPLARRRAAGAVSELRAKDLRFTLAESGAFVNEVAGLSLSEADLASLDARTEGWVAGLQMASLTMAGRRDVPAFVRAFGGSNRFVLDYLVEEVLAQQDPTVRSFLLKTSILERLTAPLCDCVAARGDSQRILDYLDQTNLFTLPLDDSREWYRYHALFADLLLQQLVQTHPDQIPDLYARASGWHETQQQIPEALHYALVADDVERVAALIERVALHHMDEVELGELLAWLNKLPDAMLRRHPWLCLAQGWALAISGQLGPAETALNLTEAVLLPDTGSPGEDARIRSRVSAVRSCIEGAKGDVPKAVALARQTLRQLGDREARLRAFTAVHMGNALGWTGKLDDAADAYEIASQSSQTAGDVAMSITALTELALLRFMQAERQRALDLFQQALTLASACADANARHAFPVGLTYSEMGIVHYELNELEDALRYALLGVDRCSKWGDRNALMNAFLSRGRIRRAMGQLDAALEDVDRAETIADGLSPSSLAYIENWRVTMQLQRGDTAVAVDWTQKRGLKVTDAFDPEHQFDHMTLSRLLIARGRLPEAEGRLQDLLSNARKTGSTFRVVRCLILLSVALQGQKKADGARRAISEALDLAEPGGFVRIFVDEGQPVEGLLRQWVQSAASTVFATSLLDAFAHETCSATRHPQSSAAGSELLVEPLSDREWQVLRLLPTDLSSTDIAQELFVSKYTVRSHIRNIYGKLGVHSRSAAILRARELNLL